MKQNKKYGKLSGPSEKNKRTTIDCSGVLSVSDPFLEPVTALESDGRLLLLKDFLLLVRQLLGTQVVILLRQALVAATRHRHCCLILLLLILYQGARVLRAAAFSPCDYWSSALRGLVPFQGDVWPTQYLVAGIMYIRWIVAHRLRVEVADGMTFTAHDYPLIGGILNLQYLLSALHALAVC